MTRDPTNMKMDNVFIQMEPNTLSMKSIKKININKSLELDKTGNDVGQIYLKRVSKILSTGETKSYFLEFKNGARSKIHLHDSDQIIIGLKGNGKLVTFSKIKHTEKETTVQVEKTMNLNEGEAIMIPSGTLHWHGAIENKDSSQFSFMKNGNTFWF